MAAAPYLLLLLVFGPAAAFAGRAPPPSQPIAPPPPPQKVLVWPKPSSISWSSAVYAPLAPSFSIRASPSHPSLRHAIAYYSRLIKAERHLPLVPPGNYTLAVVPIRLLELSVSDPGVDESYTLSVPPNSASADISAATSWGAIRGLETFSQLAWAGGGQPMVPSDIEISDHPLFTHRGILLDTAPENTKRIVAAGYRAIVSSASYYYLDCGHGGWGGQRQPLRQAGEGAGGHAAVQRPRRHGRVVVRALQDVAARLRLRHPALALGGRGHVGAGRRGGAVVGAVGRHGAGRQALAQGRRGGGDALVWEQGCQRPEAVLQCHGPAQRVEAPDPAALVPAAPAHLQPGAVVAA